MTCVFSSIIRIATSILKGTGQPHSKGLPDCHYAHEKEGKERKYKLHTTKLLLKESRRYFVEGGCYRGRI